MSKLINEAFSHVEVIGPHVQKGHYDLRDQDGNIILPSLWDDTVQPGWTISQQMWPLPEPEAQSKPFPPPPHPDPESTQTAKDNRVKRKNRNAKSKKIGRLPELMAGKPPSDVARIADYKYQEADTFSRTNESQEAAPSDEAKKAVAQYYIKKWTT